MIDVQSRASQGQSVSWVVSLTGSTPVESFLIARLPEAIDVLGTIFRVSEEDGEVILTRPRWSVVGVGRDLQSARQHLCDEARALAGAMKSFRKGDLTEDAWQMRAFALRVKKGTLAV